MKKVFILAAVLFVLMYVGAEATLDRPKNDGVVHLTWATDPNPARQVQCSLFGQMYPGTEVSVDPQTGDDTKLIVRCATGTGPDILDLGQESMSTMVDAGILLDLTPYASKMGFGPSRTYPAVRNAISLDGRQYRFPCNVFADAIVYNKAIFDDHNVPYPKKNWTYDDFIRTAKMIINNPSKSGVQHMAIANYANTGLLNNLLVGNGAHLFEPDGLHSALNDPPARAALKQYHDMMFVDKILPTPADAAAMSSQGGWGSGGMDWFSDGKAAMIIIGRWYLIQIPNYPELKGKLGAVTMPRIGNNPSCTVGGTRAAGINAKSPHWKDALKFLQYLASPAYSKVIVDDGDSLPPDPDLAKNGKMLITDTENDPAFHQPFVDAINNARPLDYSPYMDASEVGRWLGENLQKVENRIETPSQASRAVADQINEQIRVNLERNPALQKLYTSRTGKPYRTDWWRN